MSARTVALLRHGETGYHRENRYAGQSDIPLNEAGLAQAAHLAAWAARTHIALVRTSDLSRSRDTANAIATAAGQLAQVDPRLRELDFGIGDGLTAGEMRERFPAERAAFERDPVAHPLPSGERPWDAVERGRAALRDAIADADGRSGIIVVVAHSTLVRLVTADLLDIPINRYRQVFPSIEPGSGIVLRTDGRSGGILSVNPQFVSGDSFEG